MTIRPDTADSMLRDAGAAEAVASPCISVCELRADGVCRGCGRTGTEIGRWRDAGAAERRDIVSRAHKRLIPVENDA